MLSKIYNKRLLFISAVITILVFFTLRQFDIPLHTDAAPKGIISFEFAKDIDSVKRILESWDSQARINAGLSLGIDYLFLVTYSFFFSILIYLISNSLPIKYLILRRIGIVFAVLFLIAGFCDAIENFALIRLLLGSENSALPVLAYYFASLKFLLIGIGLLYFLFGLILKLVLKAN